VTMVVVPDQPTLPDYERIRSVTEAATLMTAATGEAPQLRADAWVWSGVRNASGAKRAVYSAIARCDAGLPVEGKKAVHTATACALTSLRR
jgi:hypothetical protein